MKVGYLGPGGTHSHRAALSIFGPVYQRGCSYLKKATFREIAADVIAGHADFGVIPIDNTISGVVKAAFDTIVGQSNASQKLVIIGCFRVHISQDLLGVGKLDDIKVVYSKQEALQQCQKTLAALLKRSVQMIGVESTTAGALRALKEGHQAAAIASGDICGIYRNLRVLTADVQDNKVNETRFLVIARPQALPHVTSQLHSWFVFRSSPSNPVLGNVMGLTKSLDILAVSLHSSVSTDPYKGEQFFLLEVQGDVKEQKFHRLLERTAKDGVQFVGTGLMELEEFKKWLDSQRESGGDNENLLTTLPPVVQKSLGYVDDGSNLRIYSHSPVTTTVDVWEVLGIQGTEILKTLIFEGLSTHRKMYCTVLGSDRVDVRHVSALSGEICRLVGSQGTANHTLLEKDVSPLICEQETQFIDPAVRQTERVFMGVGLPEISVSLPGRALERLPNVRWVDLRKS